MMRITSVSKQYQDEMSMRSLRTQYKEPDEERTRMVVSLVRVLE